MARKQGRAANVIYGICTNTGGKEDGTPCSMCRNKEVQAIHTSKDFVCEECGEKLTKVEGPDPGGCKRILSIFAIAMVLIGCGVGAFFLFSKQPLPDPLLKLDLSHSELHLLEGDSDTLVSFFPSNDSGVITFESNNSRVAMVLTMPNGKGVVYGMDTGEAVITAALLQEHDTLSTCQCSVFVKKKEIKQIPPPEPKDCVQVPKKEYDLGWGKITNMKSEGKPHGQYKVDVTKVHTIELGGINRKTVTVYPGETFDAKFENGRLRSGDIHHKDGSVTLFMVL